MNTRPFLTAVLFVSTPLSPALAGPAEKSVTTTWLPDPFPNAAPLALDRRVTVEINMPRRTPSVLLGVYDVENDALSVSAFTQPSHGTAALEKDGTFLYTPQRDYVGSDEFTFTISDARGAASKAAMKVRVIRPTGRWLTTRFTDLAEVQADGKPLEHGKGTTVPRAVDWDGDGKTDLLVGAGGAVWFYRNAGTAQKPAFAAGVRLQAGGSDIRIGDGHGRRRPEGPRRRRGTGPQGPILPP
jgi:hypothetical protein